jgi:hypothetical protein
MDDLPKWQVRARAAWLCGIALALCTRAAFAQSTGVEARRLPSGLLVLVVANATSAKTVVSTAVFAGFRDEPDTLRGLAHLAEHVATRETRSGKSLAALATANGIEVATDTRGDMTVFTSSGSTTTETLQEILELERLRLSDLLVSPSTVSAERQRVREEMGERMGDLHDGNVLFGPNRLSRSTSHADLPRINDREVRTFVARYYVPGNAAILIESPLASAEAMKIAERVFGTLPPGRTLPRPVYRDSTRIVSTGRRGPVANGGGYGLAVTIPGLQHPSRPALERDLAVLRMRIANDEPASARVMMTDQAPASMLSIRVSSGAALDSVLALLDGRPTIAPSVPLSPTNPDLLDCEAAGDWRYCRVIADARATPPSSERLDALSTYVRGFQMQLVLWP